jgi:hypothetical protein
MSRVNRGVEYWQGHHKGIEAALIRFLFSADQPKFLSQMNQISFLVSRLLSLEGVEEVGSRAPPKAKQSPDAYALNLCKLCIARQRSGRCFS